MSTATYSPFAKPADGTTNETEAAALTLLRLGLWPVAIRAAGESMGGGQIAKGKEPIGKAWGESQWDEVRLRHAFASHPERGVGICFGPGRAPGGRWLIDLEGDGPKAANSLAIVLGTAQELITPSWISRRGSHTVFATSEDDALRLLDLLPQAGATESRDSSKAGVWHLDALPDLEWRIGGYKPDRTVKQVQSVVPPPKGEDGVPRAWKTSADTEVAELPDSVFAVLEALVERAAIQAEPNGEPVTDTLTIGGGRGSRRPRRTACRSGIA